MATPVHLPDLGGGDQPLSVSAWFVETNDNVETGDCIVEVLMSGITCDVAAPLSGVVVSIEKSLGQTVKTGDVLAWIEPSAT
jgi:pyruvate/2-oxoglutarate dehydrogenase complex dihydrolipoamide acyltransferase (E2) component